MVHAVNPPAALIERTSRSDVAEMEVWMDVPSHVVPVPGDVIAGIGRNPPRVMTEFVSVVVIRETTDSGGFCPTPETAMAERE